MQASVVPMFFSDLSFIFKRLWRQRGLVACVALGLVLATGLAVTIPLYADAANYNLLNTALASSAAQTHRPPFTFIFNYVGSWHGPISVSQYNPANQYIDSQIQGSIGLPLETLTRLVSTDNMQLYPDQLSINRSQRLDLVKLTFLSGVFDQVRLVEGRLPQAVTTPGDPLEALASLQEANDLNLKTGATYLLYSPNQVGGKAFQQAVTITGIWLPKDASDPYWFYAPQSYDKKLLIPEETFFGQVATGLLAPVNDAIWRAAFDGTAVHSEDALGLLTRIDQTVTRLDAILPYTSLDTSPAPALRTYYQNTRSLTGSLLAFSAPVLGLVFYFLQLVASMLVRSQRNEIAVLRSRGASRGWVLSLYLAEWGILALLALVLGTLLGMEAARLVGHTQSFLDFSRSAPVPLRLTPLVIGIGLGTELLAIGLSLLPAWLASRFTVVSYKQDRARASQAPWWQRIYLDLMLLLPSAYGWYTLQAGSSGALTRLLSSGGIYANPLAFLLPTLFITGLALFILRLLPGIISALAWAFERLPGTVPVLVLRQLSRAASAYQGPLLLMLVTISLAGFTASMARTIDSSLVDATYFDVGADLNLAEQGQFTPLDNNQSSQGSSSSQSSSQSSQGVWDFLPISQHLTLPGVEAAARVGKYAGDLQAAGRDTSGRLVGIDRVDFPKVAFFRPDFASEPLVALMNRLASDPSALLVDGATWAKLHLSTGDKVTLTMTLAGKTTTLDFKMAGVFTNFPTLYSDEGPVFVANLDYLFEELGGLQPYEVWLKTAPGTDTAAIIQAVNDLGVAVVTAQDARADLEAAFSAPQRQGVLGLLSVGFLAALLITVIGFLLNVLFSFRERFIQLGILRAIGLTVRQMGAFLGSEQLGLILIGLAGGTGITLLASLAFIPTLPLSTGLHPGALNTPVLIAWEDIWRVYTIFGAMVLAGLAASLLSLRSMKVFQAVKMGENL